MIVLSALVFAWSCNEEPAGMGESSGIEISLMASDTVSARILFSPDANTSYFEYMLGTEADYEAFKNRTDGDVEKVNGCDPVEIPFPGLVPNTIYTVYAQSFADNGKSLGINAFKFITKDNRFKIEKYYVLDNTAGIRIEFANEYYSCRYYLGSAADKDAFVKGEIEGKTIANMEKWYIANYYDLKPETDYVFYAVGTDRLGIDTDLIEIPFRTFASDECPNVTLKTEVDIYTGNYEFVPNDKCGKIIGGVYTAGIFSGGTEDALATLIAWDRIQWNGTESSWGGESLQLSYTTPGLANDYELDVYAVVCDKEMTPVGVKYFKVSTPSLNENLEKPNPVKVEVSDITSKGATYTFKADETVFAYMYETVEADWYDDFMENNSDWYETYLHDTFFRNGQYFHYGKEDHQWTESAGQSNFRYYAAAAPMNANGPRTAGWGDITLVSYTTK